MRNDRLTIQQIDAASDERGRCYCCPRAVREHADNKTGAARVDGRKLFRFYIQFDDEVVGASPYRYCYCWVEVWEWIGSSKYREVALPGGSVQQPKTWFSLTADPKYIRWARERHAAGRLTSLAGYFDYLDIVASGEGCLPHHGRELEILDAPSPEALPIHQVIRFSSTCPGETNPCEHQQVEVHIWYSGSGDAQVDHEIYRDRPMSGPPGG